MFSISILQFFNFSILPKRRFPVHPALQFGPLFRDPKFTLRGDGEDVKAYKVTVVAEVVIIFTVIK